ncbi:ABC transporter substrate-binding protein [Sphingomonas oleivorans]|uniref:ABC transporter substrate-binding protein n=1 Tax=Sphingomonas oleivorans TaxID=1735121 RepID=A0A2T5G158_9SPHN|nr:ABC transporter substrate-binding protein [Sphingomonas oleivorans]PTQ12886.1 ABC transporter substrate-binding protein [Sphingomonas oleivorans]
MNLRPILLAALVTLTACDAPPQNGPILASVIGGPPELVDPSHKPLPPPSALLLMATAQGLVRFDGAGQIEPGLAMRWAVSDDGLYYTFRLADGTGLTAEDVARRLRAAIGPTSRNPLKPLLDAIEEIVAVTPEVIEIRLRAPRPNLLELLAQPELALIGEDGGTGPFHVTERPGDALILRPVTLGEDVPDGKRHPPLALRGERAGLAVARFTSGQAMLVTGGSFADLPVARAVSLPQGVLRFDPVGGLFGFAIVEPRGFLAESANRRALSLAIDRGRIVGLIGAPNLYPTDRIVATRSAGAPRREDAAAIVALWRTGGGDMPRLRIAMPRGPGADMLFRLVAADWAAIGVQARRVELNESADLRLIDAIAPTDDNNWHLRRFACGASPLCSPEADAALAAAGEAATPETRAIRLATAEAYLESVMPFIAIAQPVRWSLVQPLLNGWLENKRGIHPLNHLRTGP